MICLHFDATYKKYWVSQKKQGSKGELIISLFHTWDTSIHKYYLLDKSK